MKKSYHFDYQTFIFATSLLNKEGAGSGGLQFGHLAILIGNDRDGWVYVSKDGRADLNGDGKQDGTALSGGPAIQTIKKFDTVEEALNDKSLSAYDEGYRLKTTGKEDAKALKVSINKAGEDFHVTNNNCADVCSTALESVGYNGGTTTSEYAIDRLGNTIKNTSKSPIPSVRFKQIVKNNPDGERLNLKKESSDEKK